MGVGRIIVAIFTMSVLSGLALAAVPDPSLIVYYDFAKNPDSTARDLSGHGNHGTIHNAQWVAESAGRKGVLRLDSSSWIECGRGDAVRIDGDMTLEMWVRQTVPITQVKLGRIFMGMRGFQLGESYYTSLVFYYVNRDDDREMMAQPVDHDLINETWAHVAIVVEYPRMKFYRDGKLVHDAYMPFPGIAGARQNIKTIGSSAAGTTLPMELGDFRLYRRALTPDEIAANAAGKIIARPFVRDLAVEPNWYENTATVRLTTYGIDYTGRTVNISLQGNSKVVDLADASLNGSRRFVASTTFPLTDEMNGQSFKAMARIAGSDFDLEKAVTFERPDWIHTKDGYSDEVLAPWTPVQTSQGENGVSVNIWGREYGFGPAPFLQNIQTKQQQILAAPMNLTGQIDGKAIQWKEGTTNLGASSRTAAIVNQSYRADGAKLTISARTEYDGYTIYDCTLTSDRNLNLNNLQLDIPLKSQFATLCYGDRVLPEQPDSHDLYTQWYSGAVKGKLDFRFSPNIWLGNDDLGLTWQAESNQYWRNTDTQKAIQILPDGETTTFRVHFVDRPTPLKPGQSLHYRFALLATPVKPLKRDAWSWRIAVDEPQGADLSLPDRKAPNGEPILKFYYKQGIRNLFTNTSDIWPWPMPVHEKYIKALHRMIAAAHDVGMKVHPYLVHQRFPVVVPEFDIYGLNMASRPLKQYVQSSLLPDAERPGPLAIKYGANSQGCVFMCPQSQALQDAYVHSLAERLKTYGDDGVYLDGTCHIGPLCENVDHGCGWRDTDGKIHGTYPTFAIRAMMKRIYTVVKMHNPDDIVDVHCSWGWNPAGLAYADVQWNGEQFGPRYKHRGPTDGYIPGALSLDQFRTEFTGRQLGIGAEMLTYRLGNPYRGAAISLLFDISPRLYTNNFDNWSAKSNSYYAMVPALWKMRDAFGAEEAQRLYYYNNQDYVTVSGDDCHATLLKNPQTGVLVFVSNLSRNKQEVTINLNLDRLGLLGKKLDVFNPITSQSIEMTTDEMFSIPLDSQQWMYVWVKPTK